MAIMPPAALDPTFFGRLRDDDRARLSDLGRRFTAPRGAVLMYAHERGDCVMILLAGRVKVTRATTDGRETLLAIGDPGDMLGELACFGAADRVATVTALDRVEVLAIGAPAFRAYVETHPTVASALVEVLSRRCRETALSLTEHASSDTLGRVAARLAELGERYGTPHVGGIDVGLELSQDELAAWAGASRAGVAKALKTLRDLGWIQTGRRRIVIRDIEALRRRAL